VTRKGKPARPTIDASPDEARRLRRLLDNFARLLVLNGYSPRHLARDFSAVCASLDEPRHPREPRRTAFTIEVGHVLSHWYTDPLCVDGRGKPRPLPAKGPGLSVSDLVRRASPGLDPGVAISTLVQHKALKRQGRLYVPTNRRIVFDPSDAAASARGLLPLEGLLSTLHRNWAGGRKAAETLEATAINPAYPRSQLRALKKQLKDRGLAFLTDVDSTMRRGEARGTDSEPRARVGVSVFVFEEPDKPSGGRLARRRPART
jgi:hypothetical protein